MARLIHGVHGNLRDSLQRLPSRHAVRFLVHGKAEQVRSLRSLVLQIHSRVRILRCTQEASKGTRKRTMEYV